MSIRNTVVLGMALALATSSFGAYQARLYFKNATTGASGPGVVWANYGDLIEIWWYFLGDETRKWGTFQATIRLRGTALGPPDFPSEPAVDRKMISTTEANAWRTRIQDGLDADGHLDNMLLQIYHRPANGIMRDWAINPADATKPYVADVGLYALLGVSGATRSSWDIHARLFYFTVQSAAPLGEELRFDLDNRVTGTGLSTRILDYVNASVDITDNYVKIIPEPGSIAAIATGLVGLLALRRRK